MKTLLLILIFTTMGFSADLFDLFYKYLPPKIQSIESIKRKMINSELEKLGRLNPSLIYYYIEYLKSREIENYPGYFTYRLKKFDGFKQKNAWINSQLEILDKMTLHVDIRQRIKEYLQSAFIHINKKSSEAEWEKEAIDLDKNKLHFYNVLYLSSDRDLIYDPSKKYILQEEEIEKNIKSTIISKGSIEDLLNSWYIFKNDDIVQLVLTKIDKEEKINRGNNISFYGGLTSQVEILPVTFPIPIPELNRTKNSHETFQLNYGIKLGFSHKTYFKEYLVSYSYIKSEISVNYLLRFPLHINYDGKRSFSVENDFKVREEIDVDTKQIDSYIFNIEANFLTPILIPNNFLFLEAGVHFRNAFTKFEMKYKYLYDYVKFKPGTNQGFDRKGESEVLLLKKNKTKFFVWPIIRGNYYTGNFYVYSDITPTLAHISINYLF